MIAQHMHSRRSPWGWVALAALGVACDDGGGTAPAPDAAAPAIDAQPRGDAPVDAALPDVAPRRGPEIEIEPPSIEVVAAVGARSEPVEIILRNAGNEDLNVSEVGLAPSPGARQFELQGVPVLPVAVAPDGGTARFALVYHPDAVGEHTAIVQVRSDDFDEALVSIRVEGHVPQPCIRLVPPSVALGTVEPGMESARFRLEINSCGDLPLTLGEIRIEGDAGFRWEAEGDDPQGATLAPGARVPLSVFYVNTDLADGEVAMGSLTIESDAPGEETQVVPIRVSGGGGPTCVLAVEPGQIDFGVLRVGLTRALEITLANAGSGECEIRELRVDRAAGIYQVSRAPDSMTLAPESAVVFELSYQPEIPNVPGDRAELVVDYRDVERMENRRETALVIGVADTARMHPVPPSTDFGEVTAPDCASLQKVASGANAGFVPVCVTDISLEGPDCEAFVIVSQPVYDPEGCFEVTPEIAADVRFQYQPDAVGHDECTMVVTSDAQEGAVVRLALVGEGVPSAVTVDAFRVGRLNANLDARWFLSRPADEPSVQVWVDDEPSDVWAFDARRNAVVFAPADHPPRGATVRVEYLAECFERR